MEGPAYFIETGVGQGFVTRRLIEAMHPLSTFLAYDTEQEYIDAIPRENLPDLDIVFYHGTPNDHVMGLADLVVIDSDLSVRPHEIAVWGREGAKDSELIVHDVQNNDHPTITTQAVLALGIWGKFLENERGGWHGVHP
jgi:hypothetical protein